MAVPVIIILFPSMAAVAISGLADSTVKVMLSPPSKNVPVPRSVCFFSGCKIDVGEFLFYAVSFDQREQFVGINKSATHLSLIVFVHLH